MARFLVLNCVDATCLRAPWASGTETNDVDSIRPRGGISDEAYRLCGIANQESWSLLLGKRFDNLLRRQLGCRIFRDVEVDDSLAVVTQHDKGEEYLKCGSGNGEKVDGDDVGQVAMQVCPPSLRRRLAMSNSIPTHGCLETVCPKNASSD